MSIETFPLTTLGNAAQHVVSALHQPRPEIERVAITSREQWLALRTNDVTASAISALLGASEYQSAYSLWAAKSGLISEVEDEAIVDENSISISPMGRGTLFEDKAAELLRRMKPSWTVIKCSDYYRETASRIGATPDLLVHDPARGLGTVQIKNPEPSIYRKKWQADGTDIEPPLDYVIQTNVEAHLTGAKWAAIGALVISHRVELRLIPISLHSGLMPELRERVAAFWRNVDAGIAPDPDFGRDAEIIAKLNRDCDGSSIDLSNDNRIRSMLDEDADLASKIKDLTEQRKAIKAETLAKIGPAETAIVDGKVVLTARTIHKKAFEVKATSYRDLRFRRSA